MGRQVNICIYDVIDRLVNVELVLIEEPSHHIHVHLNKLNDLVRLGLGPAFFILVRILFVEEKLLAVIELKVEDVRLVGRETAFQQEFKISLGAQIESSDAELSGALSVVQESIFFAGIQAHGFLFQRVRAPYLQDLIGVGEDLVVCFEK